MEHRRLGVLISRNSRRRCVGVDDIDARIVILSAASHHKEDDVSDAKTFIRDSIKADAQFSATAIDHLGTLNVSFD